MTTHTELFTWTCDQCHRIGTEGRLTRKEAAEDGQMHFSFHLEEALKLAQQEEHPQQRYVGLVRVIPVPAPTNTELL